MIIGSKVYRKKTCDDSFAWAREYLHHAPDGSVFLADELTKARGRLGRVWQNYPGQMTLTLLLKPQNLKSIHSEDFSIRLNQLNMALSLGILEPIKKYGVGLKWPNDFVFDSKKLAGMLIQVVWQNSEPVAVLLGFSINVNNKFSAGDPLVDIATSLADIVNQNIDMRTLYFELLASLNNFYRLWMSEKFDVIYKKWRSSQVLMGKSIKIHKNDGSVVNGLLKQILPNGDAIICDSDKKEQIISFYLVEEIKISE